MIITAKIKPKSHIDQHWKDRNQVSGQLSGVRFVLVGGEYVAENLAPDDIIVFEGNPAVEIEMSTELTGA